MSIIRAKEALQNEYMSLIKQATSLKKAIELLDSGIEVQQLPMRRAKRQLSPEALANIRAGVQKRMMATKEKAPATVR